MRTPKEIEKSVKDAMILFWDKVVFDFPELDQHDFPDVLTLVCHDAVDRYLKHAEKTRKTPITSEELLNEVFYELGCLPNTILKTSMSFVLLDKIQKHLDRIKP